MVLRNPFNFPILGSLEVLMQNPSKLPGLHEAQERLETENIVVAGLAEELGVATCDWGDGLWSVRCTSLPGHQPGNQITGIRPADLDRLP